MKLTPELKAKIDAMPYEQMLSMWRFAPSREPMFQGESAEYFAISIRQKRDADPDFAIRASKNVGWSR